MEINFCLFEDVLDFFGINDELIFEDFQNDETPRINKFYSLSKASMKKRIKLFEKYLFGRKERNNYDVNTFKRNKCGKIKKYFGRFFMETIINLYKNKLLTIFRTKSGYKHLLLLYQYYLNKRNLNKDEEFLKCFPSLKKLSILFEQNNENFNDKKNFKNLLFIKIYIDLYDNYIKDNSINYQKRKLFFKLSINYYKKISSKNYDEIKWNIVSMNLHFYTIKAHQFYLEMNEKKYIEYFSDKFLKLKNLIGGFPNMNNLFYL